MNKRLVLGAFLVATSLASPVVYAGACDVALEAAQAAAAADPKCGNTAKDLSKQLKQQFQTCKDFREKLQVCRQSKLAAKKECDDGTKKENRQCKQAAEKEKQDCREEAKQSAEFEICKDERKISNKMAGAGAACFGKYWAPAVSVCVAESVASIMK